MFVVRIFCLEASFFANYRSGGTPLYQIDALIPEEYRLPIYLFPGICSVVINLIRLVVTTKKSDLKYYLKHPQFILCPMFCPLMFEGNPKESEGNKQPVRVWKTASILNAIFIGCIPQILLLASDYHQRVRFWPFQEINTGKYYDTNALMKHRYGNTIFSVSTLVLYGVFISIFFLWDKCLSIKRISTNESAADEKQEIGSLQVDSKNDQSVSCQSKANMKQDRFGCKVANSKRNRKIIAVIVFITFCIGIILAIFYAKYRLKSDGSCQDTLPSDYQGVITCPNLAKNGYCYDKWKHLDFFENRVIGSFSNSTRYVYQDCKQSCNNCESTPCKNDSECDHSNCYYCTSAGYCRIAGLNYCGIYDCGIGDGSCISGFTGSFAGCKSNLTCGRDNFKYYHPLPDHCLCHHVMCRKYSACVPKGI